MSTLMQAYDVLPYFGAKLAAELPVGAVFPLLFGAVVYPLTGLNPRPSRSDRSGHNMAAVVSCHDTCTTGGGVAWGRSLTIEAPSVVLQVRQVPGHPDARVLRCIGAGPGSGLHRALN
jgi:hypothetical protein